MCLSIGYVCLNYISRTDLFSKLKELYVFEKLNKLLKTNKL